MVMMMHIICSIIHYAALCIAADENIGPILDGILFTLFFFGN